MNHIEAAVLPLKSEAIVRAEKEARAIVEQVAGLLDQAGGDLQICAPYPSAWNMGRNEYLQKLSKYDLFRKLTSQINPNGGRRPRDPEMAKMDSERIERYVEAAKKNAAEQYDLFVAKLNSKIGEVTAAELEGNHVWGYSFLTVTKPDNTKEIWKTQMIVNQSKLGLLFNQFPTRKVKNKK